MKIGIEEIAYEILYDFNEFALESCKERSRQFRRGKKQPAHVEERKTNSGQFSSLLPTSNMWPKHATVENTTTP